MTLFDRACARSFPVLVDFVDGARRGPETDTALLHLERCARCRADLETTALTVQGLRHLARAASAVEPPPDAWAQLRSRIERTAPSRFLLLTRLSTGALTIAVVAALALPWAIGRGDASGAGDRVRSDAPGPAFDPAPVILAERAFERPSDRPGAVVVMRDGPARRLSDSAPPGRLDGWLPVPLTSERGVPAPVPTRRSTTR